MIELNFRKTLIEACENHAEYYIKSLTERYSRRKQTNPEKIKKDMIVGKIGELMVYKYFCGLYGAKNVVKPYLYNGKNAREDNDFCHDPDIIIKNPTMNVHIKTQDYHSAKKYGEGWVFERTALEKSKKQDLSNDFICFGVVDIEGKEYRMCVFQKYDVLFKKNMFSKMDVFHLRSFKQVVRYKTFKQKKVTTIINENEI